MTQCNDRVDVVLIYPKTGMDLGSTVAPPFALLTIAAPLPQKGIRVKIIDQRVDKAWAQNLRVALKQKPLCCGISTMTGTQIYFSIEAAKIIREETGGAVPIVWGGCHPTILPEQTLKSEYVDIVCVGEGDETFVELVETLQLKQPLANVKGIAYLEESDYVFTGERPLLDVETLLPTPWELVDVEAYIHPDLYLQESRRVLDVGQTSRGCPYRCAFCCSAAIRKHKWRPMSVEKSLAIIVENVKKFRLDGIWLRDDEFYIDPKRATEICKGIIVNKLNIAWYTSGTRVSDLLRATDEQMEILKKSGAYLVKVGAESGSNRVLKFIRKGQTVEQILAVNQKCKRFGIKTAFSLMCGFPTETFAEIDQTIDLFFRLQEENPEASCETIAQFTAMPGTELYDIGLQSGLKPPERLEDWANWLFHDTDYEGKRLPWFNAKQRQAIGNLNYLSILSKTGAEIVKTINNKPLSIFLGIIVKPASKYFAWRLKHKYYSFVPEIRPIKWFQHFMFSSK
jgi:anaerobic magnesium-protoporphyrin IX monomethyl ester cyclase